MCRRADGSIVFYTRINNEKASSQMLQLENQIKKTSDRIHELKQKMNQFKDAKVPTKEYELLLKEVEKNIKKQDDLKDKLREFDDVSWNTKKDLPLFRELQEKLETCYSGMDRLQDKMKQLEANGKAFTLGSNTEDYQKLSQNLAYTSDRMEYLCRRHEELRAKQVKNTSEYSKMGKVARKTSQNTGSFLKSLISGFKKLNVHAKTSHGLLGRMGSRLKSLALSLMIFNWISKGFNAMISGMKEGINNLARHSSEFNETMSELKSATEQAKNSLATAFAPVLSMLIPYITSFVNLLNSACDSIARFFAFLSGKTTYTRAKKQNIDYAGSLDKVADSAKNAVKELGSLASFDELNVLNQNNNDSDTGSSSSGSTGTGDAFEEVPLGDIADWMKQLKQMILEGDWEGIGELIGQKLTDAMNSIKWEEVYATARDFGKNLALFLNGLISPELFGATGKTIAGALNTALHFLDSFGETFEWDNLGESLATGIDEFFRTWDKLIKLLFGKECEEMIAMLWSQWIMLEKRTYSQVPRTLKEQVKEILIDSGCGDLVTE